MPTLIAAGRQATEDGTPIVQRLDLEWPQFVEAQANDQYLLTPDLLMAPIGGGLGQAGLPDADTGGAAPPTPPVPHANGTRQVWIPPGYWVDAWTGVVVEGKGSQMLQVTRPANQAALWHRQGSMLVCTADPGLSVRDQTWEHLVLEIHPFPLSGVAHALERRVFGRQGDTSHAPMVLTLNDDGFGRMNVTLDVQGDRCDLRRWTLRFHLRAFDIPTVCVVNGQEMHPTWPWGIDAAWANYTVLFHGAPSQAVVTPLGGAGSRPPKAAGPIAEVHMPHVDPDVCTQRRTVSLSYHQSDEHRSHD